MAAPIITGTTGVKILADPAAPTASVIADCWCTDGSTVKNVRTMVSIPRRSKRADIITAVQSALVTAVKAQAGWTITPDNIAVMTQAWSIDSLATL